MKYKIILILPFLFFACHQSSSSETKKDSDIEEPNNVEALFIEPNSNTILECFKPEKGFERENYTDTEFGHFLQQLPLKAVEEKVRYFDGNIKDKPDVYNSVINLPIGTKDLHQCADATMRLRADYLYQQKRYNDIAFNFASDGLPRDYVSYANGDNSPEKYWSYLEYIFSYANTASLKAQLRTIHYTEVKIGDLLIQKGNPYGHAVMVVDLITDGSNKKVLLAQSYMPAQELQILINPMSSNGSPWYEVNAGDIITPEWHFTNEDWKTWE
ncbi:DUF4846 domain-containing protein [Faecalibacter sp. LW9]|uniref:DUF4846 domain-containing protein n=1 Tax=Faecalibacter sp. LW9 TaxID=3103144 RepID=UPI002AFDD616|nr:DUF4846 domain-containing protein [Faecalibacter sp. LW9]